MEKCTAEEHFIGVDFHKQTTVVTRLRKDGSRVGKTEKYASTPEGLRAFRESCTASGHVAVEAAYPWAFFADTFDDFEGEWVLGHPLKNRLIAESRNKNDTVDSKVLADLLRTNFLARAWIAPKEIREARELLRYRCSLARVAPIAVVCYRGCAATLNLFFRAACSMGLVNTMGPSIGQRVTGHGLPSRKYAAVLQGQAHGAWTSPARTGLLCMYSSFSTAFFGVYTLNG